VAVRDQLWHCFPSLSTRLDTEILTEIRPQDTQEGYMSHIDTHPAPHFRLNRQYRPYARPESNSSPGSHINLDHHFDPGASKKVVQYSRAHCGSDVQSGSVAVEGVEGRSRATI